MNWRKWLSVLAAAGLLVALLVAIVPVIVLEIFIAAKPAYWEATPPPADPKAFRARPGPAAGQVIDGFWRIEQIAPDTWAIGEPANAPDNYEYLLVGKRRALLIDSGATTTHDIHRAIAGLTALPVSVIPSHLHFDHVNGLKYFQSISLIDLPETRGHGRGDVVQLGRYQYMGASPPSFKVTEWVKPGATLDLGGRKVEIWSTPGHTTNSVSVWEPERKRLYTGDLIYPTSLYAFMLDSSLSTYISTLDRLQTTLPADAKLYGAHCCRNDAPPHAPWLDMTDVHDARMAVSNVMSGQAKGRGLVLRNFPVNARMTLITLYPLGNW